MLVIAGHNGAGKSTCYRMYFAEVLKGHLEEHIDPDAVERGIRAALSSTSTRKSSDDFSRLAQAESERLRQQFLENRTSFSFETVLSDTVGHKLDFMRQAVGLGYFVVLIAVGLDSPERSAQRVALRVQRGGHNVPSDRIKDRYPRVINNLRQAVDIVSLSIILDNSGENQDDEFGCYDPVSLHFEGMLIGSSDNPPGWWQ